MGRLFGTDGVRGIAGEDMTCELAMAIGRAAATVLAYGRRRRPLVVMGKDTRISSDMLGAALAAGLCSVGADVIDLGVISTPAVAYLVGKYKADAGVMISASHNPYAFNGIKIFNGDGFKLPDELEEQIENLIEKNDFTYAKGENLGQISHCTTGARDYIEHLKSTIPYSLEGMNIVVDCANGSASATARTLFEELGANAVILHDAPDGVNINEGCGSTHLEQLQDYVRTHKVDAGVAFDGDADRCLFVDETGEVVDGDYIMAICGLDMQQRGKLRRSTIVGTVLTNLGFARFCEANGMKFAATKVGDRYVLEEMELEGYTLGGEQSGHIIFRDFATTGDGQLTAIQLLCLLKRCQKSLSELAKVMTRLPQVMVNVTVSAEGKLEFYNNDVIKEAIRQQKEALGDTGRVLVRVSGTEPLIRVMVEGQDESEIQAIADHLAELVKKELGRSQPLDTEKRVSSRGNSLVFCLLRVQGTDVEDEVIHMEQPHAAQHNAADEHLVHQDKADAHGQGHGDHDADLGATGHGPLLPEAFEVLLVQLGGQKPPVQPVAALGEEKAGAQQKGSGGQQGKHRTHGAQRQADKTQCNVEVFHKQTILSVWRRSGAAQLSRPCSTL